MTKKKNNFRSTYRAGIVLMVFIIFILCGVSVQTYRFLSDDTKDTTETKMEITVASKDTVFVPQEVVKKDTVYLPAAPQAAPQPSRVINNINLGQAPKKETPQATQVQRETPKREMQKDTAK